MPKVGIVYFSHDYVGENGVAQKAVTCGFCGEPLASRQFLIISYPGQEIFFAHLDCHQKASR
jgi:hypothetical protein